MSTFDPTRLISQLQNTGLAIKDNPLYQLIYQMLKSMAAINTQQNASSSSSSSKNTIINQTVQQLLLDSDSGGDGEIGPPGVAGAAGGDGVNGMVPYFIASTETFTIPEFKQALFAMNIDNEGILVIDGFLIEVDGEPESVAAVGPMGPPGIDGDNLTEEFYAFITNNSTEISISTTGNIDDLDFGNSSLIRMTNATLSTIRGLKAGRAGQIVTIASVGAAEVDLAHQNTNSSANNRFINDVTSGVTPLAAGCGIASYIYDGTTSRWRLIAHEQGDWIVTAFNAGDYTASAGTWTVAAFTTNQYYIRGRTLTWSLAVGGTTSTTPVSVFIATPAGYTMVETNGVYYCSNNGSSVAEGGYYDTSNPKIRFQQFGNVAFGAGTVNVFVTAVIPIT